MRPTRLLLLALLPLLVVSCAGGPEADGAQILPIDEILDSGIVVAPDPSGTAATLTVTTSVPVACAVIYGEDGSFGSITTDDDMAGGAHADHAPTLAGLEPETEYEYVLQGSDANGNLYRSEVRSFTTPSAEAIDRPGENVAATATIGDVSSEFSDVFAAANAIDGDPATEWSSDGDGDDASITIELPAATDIVGFGLHTRSMGDGSSIIESFQVTVDDDEVLGPFDADTDGLAIAEAVTAGQRLRFEAVTTTGGNTGVVEIEIYTD